MTSKNLLLDDASARSFVAAQLGKCVGSGASRLDRCLTSFAFVSLFRKELGSNQALAHYLALALLWAFYWISLEDF